VLRETERVAGVVETEAPVDGEAEAWDIAPITAERRATIHKRRRAFIFFFLEGLSFAFLFSLWERKRCACG